MKKVIVKVLELLCLCMFVYHIAGLASSEAGLSREKAAFEELAQMAGGTVSEAGAGKDVPAEGSLEAGIQKEEAAKTVTSEEDIPGAGTSEKGTLPAGTSERISPEEAKPQSSDEEADLDREFVVTVEPRPAPVRFADLLAKNGDFAGWLAIEGTAVNYPVVLSTEDPDFYLEHDFNRQPSKSGTPYIGAGCAADSGNVIIFGHNMKNGTMFADLLKYADEEFLRAHPVIRFDTPYESAEYEIIAVFREKVHYRDETNVFRYYACGGDLSREEFEEYVKKVKELSLYDTGKTAKYGQQLITLSTCSYHTENGRFAVVAVQEN